MFDHSRQSAMKYNKHKISLTFGLNIKKFPQKLSSMLTCCIHKQSVITKTFRKLPRTPDRRLFAISMLAEDVDMHSHTFQL